MVRNDEAVLGARMMGGGFGGCTINIVKKGMESELINAVSSQYRQQFSRELKTYAVTIDDGTSLVE
jgi:galactokinase